LLWFFISQEQLSLQGSCFWAGACCFESFSEATLPRFWWSLSQVCHPSSPFTSCLRFWHTAGAFIVCLQGFGVVLFPSFLSITPSILFWNGNVYSVPWCLYCFLFLIQSHSEKFHTTVSDYFFVFLFIYFVLCWGYIVALIKVLNISNIS
jgi:hypothetical protein